MFRQIASQASRRLIISARPFSISARTLAEGDLGAPKVGGNAFSKREKASEDKYVRDQELSKLKLLRQKLQDQRKNIDDLDKDISAMMEEGHQEEKK